MVSVEWFIDKNNFYLVDSLHDYNSPSFLRSLVGFEILFSLLCHTDIILFIMITLSFTNILCTFVTLKSFCNFTLSQKLGNKTPNIQSPPALCQISQYLLYFREIIPKITAIQAANYLTETIIFSAVILIYIFNKSITFIYHGSIVENRFLS